VNFQTTKLRTGISNLGAGFAIVFEAESSQEGVVFIAGAAVGQPHIMAKCPPHFPDALLLSG